MRASLLLTILSCCAIHLAQADDTIVLKNGDRFSGTVIGLSEGLMQIQIPHSETPLEIVSTELANLSLQEIPSSELPSHSQQVNLRNGDTFPGQVTGLDAESLKLDTWFAGPLSIPRSQIKSVFYGVTPQKLLYQGPNDQKEWDPDKNWQFQNGELTSTRRSSASHDLDLPDRFILRFHLRWTNSPAFRIHFCTDASSGAENHDGYYFHFSGQNVTLSRALPPSGEDNSPKHQTLGGSTRTTSDFRNRNTNIEIRVDRTTQRILFYLGDELQGIFHDPNPAPTGTRVIFESQSSSQRHFKISAIKLHEWDAVTQRLRIEPRQDENSDTLVTDEGDRYSGQILKRIESGKTSSFRVKSPLLEQEINIPETRSAILYFTSGSLPEKSSGSYKIALASGGTLDLSDIQLSKDKLTGQHPWLGKLTIDRRIVSQFTLRKTPKTVSKKTASTSPSKPSFRPKVKAQIQIEAN